MIATNLTGVTSWDDLHAATPDFAAAGRAREVTGSADLAASLHALQAATDWAPAPGAFHLFFIDLVDVTRVSIEGGAMPSTAGVPTGALLAPPSETEGTRSSVFVRSISRDLHCAYSPILARARSSLSL